MTEEHLYFDIDHYLYNSVSAEIIYLQQITAFVVQWIECQIPVLMMGVRIPSSALKKPLSSIE